MTQLEAEIQNDCCSNCGAYIKKQNVLSKQQRQIIAWFRVEGIKDFLSKKIIYEKFKEFYEIGPSAFSARISELNEFGFFHINEIEDCLVYKLNESRYDQYLKDGGLGIER